MLPKPSSRTLGSSSHHQLWGQGTVGTAGFLALGLHLEVVGPQHLGCLQLPFVINLLNKIPENVFFFRLKGKTKANVLLCRTANACHLDLV